MTDIRELLREATENIVADHPDPVDQVRRGATRRRRTWAAAGTVVAVVIAVVLPLALAPRSTPTGAVSPRPTPVSHPVVQIWEPDDGEVASGFGAIWAMQCCGGSTKPSWVDKLNPVTGQRIARIPVPGPTVTIATGAGRVWTLGATDGGPSAISVIDPATSKVTTLHLPDVKAEPAGIAIAAGSAWVTMDLLNQVWRLTPTLTGVSKQVMTVPGSPRDIAATGSGALWVQHDIRGKPNLSRIVSLRDSPHLGPAVHWNGDIYSTAGPQTLWASTGSLRTVLQLDPANLAKCLACAQANNIVVKGTQIYTAISTPRGLFVSAVGGVMSPGHTDFFSNQDLRATRETPTARIAGSGQLAPDGDGVVIGADAGLIHWVPADSGHRAGHRNGG